jgi:hypothetical protein
VRGRISGLCVAFAIALASVPAGNAAGATATTDPVLAVAARTCSAGFTHAVIGGAQKCLRRGEFCAHRYQSQYRRYGYSCTRRDARGNYHLT